MRNDIKFEDYSDDVLYEMSTAILNALEEASGELEAQVKRNTKVDTGKTKASWTHKVDNKEYVGYIGSNYDNAIWEEFGTGIHAVDEKGRPSGNGRKEVPWTYQSSDGKWHRTSGKKPKRAFQKAFDSMKNKIEKYFRERFKDL